MATATLVAVYFWWTQGEQDVMALAIPSLCCFITGWLLTLSNRYVSPHVTQREGFLVVSMMWILFLSLA